MSSHPVGPLEAALAMPAVSNGRWQSVVDNVIDGIITIDERGTIATFNPAAERIFGYAATEAIGQNVNILMPEPDHSLHDGYIEHYLRTGEAKIIGTGREVVGRRKDGSEFPMELAIGEFQSGGRRFFTGIARDITERKRLEAELRQRVEELAEADRRKNEFLAMLGHELRNPLTPIRCALHLLKLPGMSEEDVREQRDLIERQVDQLIRLVNDLLDISRIVRGLISLQKERVAVGEAISRAVEMVRPHINSRGHQLEVTVPPEPLYVEGDLVRLTQIIANLLSNSAKYQGGRGHIWVELTQEDKDAVIRVRDTGLGIPSQLLPHIFDLFVQNERTLARSQGGLGIGLTIVKRLIEHHGGSVTASSPGPGQGSTFTVRLPLLNPASQDTRPSTDLRGETGEGSAPPQRLILVVDDNVDAAKGLARMLRLWGYNARIAYDGPSALELARADHPEIVLLDIGLPGMDGYEVAHHLRAEPVYGSPLLAAVTAYGQTEDMRRSHEAGFARHFTKPVDLTVMQDFLAAAQMKH